MDVRKYNLTDEEIDEIKKVYFDYTAHKSILMESVRTNPNMPITGTKVYEDYVHFMTEYDRISTQLRIKYDNHTNVNDQWEINFDEKTLTVYSSDESLR